MTIDPEITLLLRYDRELIGMLHVKLSSIRT